MTPRQMQNEFELGVNRYDSKAIVESHVIFHWLNEAQIILVKTRYSGNNPKGESFEQTQKRTDDLRTLVKEANVTTSTTGEKPNSTKWELPSDYLLTLGEEATIEVEGTSKRVGVKECTVDTYRPELENPFSEHILHYKNAQPLRLFIGDDVELITDGNYTVTSYHLRYLKLPNKILLGGADCELPEHMHTEIVDKAVSLYLASDGDPLLQVAAAKMQEIE